MTDHDRLPIVLLLQFCGSLLAAGVEVDDEDAAVAILEDAIAALRLADATTGEVLPLLAALVEAARGRGPHARAAAAEVAAALDLTPPRFDPKPSWQAPPDRPALIARKVAVIPCGVGARQATSHEAASGQAGLYVRWEVPSDEEAARAERLFVAAGTSRIAVTVTTAGPGSMRPNRPDPLVEALADCWMWIDRYPDDDTDLGANLQEDILGTVEAKSTDERDALARRIRLVAAARSADEARLLEDLADDIEA